MGLISRVLGLGKAAEHVGRAVGGVAEVFVGNKAKRDAADHERYTKAADQFAAEFSNPSSGGFDRLVNGLNRLPRPMLALGTIGLFTYAMADPVAFSERMQGLSLVPEPLWWLLGVIVSFYFGAREMHHFRVKAPRAVVRESENRHSNTATPTRFLGKFSRQKPMSDSGSATHFETRAEDPDFNAALEEWQAVRS